MNIYCNSNGSIFHIDPSRVFQGSVGVDVVRFIGRFPSSAQVLMAYKLPNGAWTSPKMLTPVAELEEIQDANGGTFAVWEGRIGASPKIDENGAIVKDQNGNVVFDLDYTITENYGTATIQFFVYGATAPITVNGVIQNVGNGLLATASFSFEIEKGVPAVIPEVDTDDAQALLMQILNVVANTQTLYNNVSEDVQDLDKNKVNKSGDTMNGPLTVESQSGPGKVEVSDQGVFVAGNGVKGTAYDDGAIVNQGKIIVIPLKDGAMALEDDAVGNIQLTWDEKDYKITFEATSISGEPISSTTIDLVKESVVVSASYNEETNSIILTLRDGNTVTFSVADLVRGLISSSEKGQPNGVASLDAEGKVPKEQLPDDIGGGGDEYVKFTDYAKVVYDENTGIFIPKAGVIRVPYLDADLNVKDGFLELAPSTTPNINQRHAQGAITPVNMDKAWKVSATTNTETWTDEEKAAACETIGAAKETDVELLTKTVFQSGLAYQADETEAWSERTTANGLNVVDGNKAVLKKVVGNTVACKNLVDIEKIDASMGDSAVTLEVNFTQNIFFSAGELATVSTSIWRFSCTRKDGTIDYVTDENLANSGKKVTATADNPVVKIIYRGNYITAGQYSKIMIAYGDTATEYQPYFTGLKSASFAGIESGGKNLVDIPFIDGTTKKTEIVVNFAQNIFVSVGESATVSSSIWRFQFVFKDGNSFYATDIELENGGKVIKATADNPVVKIIYRGTNITAGQYSKIMIAYRDTATEYTPYIEPTVYAFPKTDTPLGTTIDFENKKITDYGVEIVLTGGENISLRNAFVEHNGMGIYIAGVANGEIVSTGYGISTESKYPIKKSWVVGSICIINKTDIYWDKIVTDLGFDDKGETDAEKLQKIRSYLAQRYADGNPVTIRYVSSTLQSETDFTEGNEYTAYKGGTEKVLENDGAEYGADNTQTVNYIFVKEA